MEKFSEAFSETDQINVEHVMTTDTIPQAFIWRRLHSLTGIWLVLFLMEHLLVNSQAALFVGQDGRGFINGANALESLPYLQVVEALFLGLPILIHTLWGIKYLRTAKYNSSRTNGATPALPEYSRNHAYTWQRITAWILLFGILAHVIHMRFLERPEHIQEGSTQYYMIQVDRDDGLYTLAQRLDVNLYDRQDVNSAKLNLEEKMKKRFPAPTTHAEELILEQKRKDMNRLLQKLAERHIKDNQVIAIAKDFGTAELLMLRNTFKKPIMIVLYTILVITACYHAFNGLWTSLIKWGVTLSYRSQMIMLRFSIGLMLIIGFLGLAAVWGTYWINLKQ